MLSHSSHLHTSSVIELWVLFHYVVIFIFQSIQSSHRPASHNT